MRKAALVLATSVAFFFATLNVEAARKSVTMPSARTVAIGTGTAVKDGDRLRIPGEPGVEYIPRTPNGTSGTPVKVLPTIDYSIPRTITQAKNLLKENLASALLQATIAAAVAGVGWVMTDGVLVKKTQTSPDPTPKDYHWVRGTNDAAPYFNNAVTACQSFFTSGGTFQYDHIVYNSNNIGATCYAKSDVNGVTAYSNVSLYGSGCTSPATYDSVSRSCQVYGSSPVVDADYAQLDSYITGQGADWLKGLLRQSCGGSYTALKPDECFQGLLESSSLSGPTTVAGPTSTSLVRGADGITTVTTSTTYNLTYGDNYFDYSKTNNIHKVNPDGTTEDTTETEDDNDEDIQAPALGDPYAPVIDKYKSIQDDVSNPPVVPADVKYSPWYSFSGSCAELTFDIPWYGSYTTGYCPYIYNFVQPIIAFLLALFTWHTCRDMWEEALRTGRPI